MTSDPTAPPEPLESVADVLARRVRDREGPSANVVVLGLRERGAVDRAVYQAVARTPTGTLDEPVRRLSAAADMSKLWLGIAAAVALVGGKRGRRAALEGVVAIGVTSAAINQGVKPVARRRRPERARPALFEDRHVPMPGSTSFPSGHAASAFAFAYAVGRHLPALAVPIRLLAAAVAYSRVHTGVHYPGDVVIGSVAGSGTAAMVAAVADRVARSRAVSDRAR
jgi:membrane-associated phospholipid phosphatase